MYAEAHHFVPEAVPDGHLFPRRCALYKVLESGRLIGAGVYAAVLHIDCSKREKTASARYRLLLPAGVHRPAQPVSGTHTLQLTCTFGTCALSL